MIYVTKRRNERLRKDTEALRDLLSDRQKWTTGARATDERGFRVDADDARAVKWCLLGGIEHVVALRNRRRLRAHLVSIIDPEGPVLSETIWRFNDRRGYAPVMGLLNDAVQALTPQPPVVALPELPTAPPEPVYPSIVSAPEPIRESVLA